MLGAFGAFGAVVVVALTWHDRATSLRHSRDATVLLPSYMLICFFASAGAWRSPSHWRMLWDMVRFNLTAARDVLQVPFPRHATSPEGSSGRWGASA